MLSKNFCEQFNPIDVGPNSFYNSLGLTGLGKCTLKLKITF